MVKLENTGQESRETNSHLNELLTSYGKFFVQSFICGIYSLILFSGQLGSMRGGLSWSQDSIMHGFLLPNKRSEN